MGASNGAAPSGTPFPKSLCQECTLQESRYHGCARHMITEGTRSDAQTIAGWPAEGAQSTLHSRHPSQS